MNSSNYSTAFINYLEKTGGDIFMMENSKHLTELVLSQTNDINFAVNLCKKYQRTYINLPPMYKKSFTYSNFLERIKVEV